MTLQARPLAKGPCWYGDTWQAARGSGRVHLGVDIGAPEGTPLQAVVVAAGSSRSTATDPGSLSGNGLKITTADGTYFFYAHLAGLAPGIGARGAGRRRPGDRHVGSTGNAGDHPPALRGASRAAAPPSTRTRSCRRSAPADRLPASTVRGSLGRADEPAGRAGRHRASSAEGATTPESLRQTDRTGEATLESSAARVAGRARRRGKPGNGAG